MDDRWGERGGLEAGEDGAVAGLGRSRTDDLLDEAAGLAEALRDVVFGRSGLPPAIDPAAALGRLQATAKLGELTALIGYCIAWLMARKAVESGELDAVAACEERWRLGGMDAVAVDPGLLDSATAGLAARIAAFHARLARLDRLLDPTD